MIRSRILCSGMAAVALSMAFTPVSFAKGSGLQQTPIVIKNLAKVEAISGDGAYLYVVNEGANLSNTAGWLENMSGHMYPIPTQPGLRVAPLLGTETGNDLFIFDEVAGSAPIAFAYQPGVGVVQNFMVGHDPFAKSMYNATVSAKGYLAAQRTNAPGGAGPEVYHWMDIDNTPVPLLQDAEYATWSPNGVTLGYFSAQLPDGQGWMGIYNANTHTVHLVASPVFTLAQPSMQGVLGWQSTGFYSGPPSTALVQWSPSGKWLAAMSQTPRAIEVWSSTSVSGGKIPVSGNGYLWGWTPDGSIYVAHNSKVSLYTDVSGAWTLAHVIRVPTTEWFNRAVSTTEGLLISTDGSQLYQITASGSLRKLPVSVNAWWYDVHDHLLYVLPKSSSRVYTLALQG